MGRDITCVSVRVLGPDPAWPCAIGVAQGDGVTGSEADGASVFFFVIRIGDKGIHGVVEGYKA